MNYIERLVSAGIDRESAGEACQWFCSQGNDLAFEKYIEECERRNKVGRDV